MVPSATRVWTVTAAPGLKQGLGNHVNNLHIAQLPFEGCLVGKAGAATLQCPTKDEKDRESWAACMLWDTHSERDLRAATNSSPWTTEASCPHCKISLQNFAAAKAPPRRQQGEPTAAVVGAASRLRSLFITLLWGSPSNPHLHLQGTPGATTKHKFINSRNMHIKQEHLK